MSRDNPTPTRKNDFTIDGTLCSVNSHTCVAECRVIAPRPAFDSYKEDLRHGSHRI